MSENIISDIEKKLPDKFCENMRLIFQENADTIGSYKDFIVSFTNKNKQAFRLNLQKDFKKNLTYLANKYPDKIFTSVPWCCESFYCDDIDLGKEAMYLAGAYYIQEASAMLPAQIINLSGAIKDLNLQFIDDKYTAFKNKNKKIILDLCAAPGGKSTRLAGRNPNAILIANDINLDRALVLLRNIEQQSCYNTIVLHEKIENIADKLLPADLVFLDVPCSGEGMFRRDAKAIKSWNKYHKHDLLELQSSLLIQAATIVNDNAYILYSTCTFNMEENEVQILKFLLENPEFELLDAAMFLKNELSQKTDLFADLQVSNIHIVDSNLVFPSRGLKISDKILENILLSSKSNKNMAELIKLRDDIAAKSLRLWPHLQDADGHFAVLMRKKESENNNYSSVIDISDKFINVSVDKSISQSFLDFACFNFTKEGIDLVKDIINNDNLYMERTYLHLVNLNQSFLKSLHVLKRGVLLGEVKIFDSKNLKNNKISTKNKVRESKFIPAHNIISFFDSCFKYYIQLDRNENLLTKYLSGESLCISLSDLKIRDGNKEEKISVKYVLAYFLSSPLGLLQVQEIHDQLILKNLFPKTWKI